MQLQVESTQGVAQTRLDIVHQPISPWTLQEVEEASQSQKVVCDEDCIRQLLGTSCRHPSCEEDINVKQTHIGATLSLQSQCRRGHQGCWTSSKRVKSRNGYPFFLTNLLFASSIFLSGNNYSKFLCFGSSST